MPHYKRKKPRRKVRDSLATDNRNGNSKKQTKKHPKHLGSRRPDSHDITE